MNPRAIVIVSIVLFVACFRAASPEPRAQQPIEFDFEVSLGDSFLWAEIGILSGDGGRLFSERVDGGRPSVSSHDWYRGPGAYSIELKFIRPDGGADEHSVPLELRETDLRVAGLVFAREDGAPYLDVDVFERAPSGLRLEPTSPISREGFASYRLTNATDRHFSTDFMLTQRRGPQGWARVSDGFCIPGSDILRPGMSENLQAESFECLNNSLAEGEYRHSLRLTERQAFVHESVSRVVELNRDFGTPSIGTFSTHLFADVPISELTMGSSSSARGGIAASVHAPDGGSGCVCTGSYVGKERLRAREGIGSSLCMTSSDLDASAFLCRPIKGWQQVGDWPPFPFRDDR